MKNHYQAITEQDPADGKWLLHIVPPGYNQGARFVQPGIWYYRERFDTKKDAHAFVKNILMREGNYQQAIENSVEYL